MAFFCVTLVRDAGVKKGALGSLPLSRCGRLNLQSFSGLLVAAEIRALRAQPCAFSRAGLTHCYPDWKQWLCSDPDPKLPLVTSHTFSLVLGASF